MSASALPSKPGGNPEWMTYMLSALASGAQASTDPHVVLALVAIMGLLVWTVRDE